MCPLQRIYTTIILEADYLYNTQASLLEEILKIEAGSRSLLAPRSNYNFVYVGSMNAFSLLGSEVYT